MRNLIRKFIFLSVALIFVLTGTVVANAENNKVNDNANLFTTSEIQKLTESIDEIINKYNIDVAIVTTNDVEGKTSRDYADDYYDNNGYGLDSENSGLVFLINMEDREVYISTSGYAIDYFTDARINNILDEVKGGLSQGNYYDSANEFLQNVDYYMNQGMPDNQYRTDENGNRIKAPMTTEEKFKRVGIYFLIAIVMAFISCLVVVLRYKNPKKGSAENYVDKKSIFFTVKRDDFVTSHITKVKIQRNNGDGGGSSTHTSSSGNSHGGGGTGF